MQREIYPNLVLWVSILASIFILNVISVERFTSVVFRLKYQKYVSKPRAKIVVALVRVCSCLVNLGMFRDNRSGTCGVHYVTPLAQSVIGIGIFLVEYTIPVLIILVTQVWVILGCLQEQARLIRSFGAINPGTTLPGCVNDSMTKNQ